MKALITITSCNRLSEVEKFIWNYLKFANENDNFHFILAVDGEDQSYIDFCSKFDIPLLYSEEREGVGLSKNRVLTKFPDYDYYFFIEDDVELLKSDIFDSCIEIYKKTGYPHLCGNFGHDIFEIKINGSFRLNKSLLGGGYFSFFTREGLDKIGGWNTLFAKYKRFGHTEHTYRFFHTKTQPAPFIFAAEFDGMIMLHNPASVTKVLAIETDGSQLVIEERTLIDSKTTYFPLQTLSNFHFNEKAMGFNEKVHGFLKENPQKYPLTKGKERKRAFGEYYALLIDKKNNSFIKNLGLAFRSMYFSPLNNELKHKMKYYF
ncbi:MAG: hypothetical protein PHQ74_11275 [Crocinitomicaceae bacterium]|nr:hypothetical protein [Crocinitomicaceae bacterium]